MVAFLLVALGAALGFVANLGARRATARLGWAASAGLGAAASWLVASLLFASALMAGVDGVADDSMRVLVDPDGPAAAAGIRDGDRILAVDSTAVHDWEALRAEIQRHGDQPVALQVQRGASWMVVPVTPKDGAIRVSAPVQYVPVPAGPALAAGLAFPARLYATTVRGVSRAAEGEVSGPIGVLRSPRGQGAPPLARALAFLAVYAAYAWPLVVAYGIVMALRRRRAA